MKEALPPRVGYNPPLMPDPDRPDPQRETYTSRLSLILTMLGVAVGLGNVWRFPYMVGRFGGAAFVLVYVLAAVLLGIPALMAEWALGRSTRRGPVGAFERAGFPMGRAVGWFLFFVMFAATGYYINALGWVLYYAVGEAAHLVGAPWADGAILPPATGFDLRSFLLQMGSRACSSPAAAWCSCAACGRGSSARARSSSRRSSSACSC